MNKKIKRRAEEQAVTQVWGQVRAQVRDQIWVQVRDQVLAQVREQVGAQADDVQQEQVIKTVSRRGE